ncbi:MAG: hypothetical protein IPH75_08055 [bacterium]|nr:hypothetical protein [bacterium]
MPLQQRHIEELKALYRKEQGVELDDKEAWAMAIRLINLFRILAQSKPPRSDKVRTS